MEKWSGKTDGLPWMQRSLVAMFRFLPVQLLYAVMALVVPFYVVFNRPAYRAIYQFGRQRLGYGPLRAFGHVCKNNFRFGQIILDRFRAYAGKRFGFEFENKQLFDALESSDKGFVQLSAHVGNYEMAGYALNSKLKRFNALVYAGETETVMQNREKLLSAHNMSMIPVKSDMSHLFRTNAALENGEIVSMPADRVFGSSKSFTCDFYGGKAQFPMGPFFMAVQKEVDALAVFVMKESTYNYRIIVRKLNGNQEGNLRQKAAALAQSYAQELESIVRRYPEQWFNYFDYWIGDEEKY